MKRNVTTLIQRARFFGKGTTEFTRRSVFPWVIVTLLSSILTACAPPTGAESPDARGDLPQDGLVYEGSADGTPGSFGRLVLEKNFQQTRMLRWESGDVGFGAIEVDFFQPQEWNIEGDPPRMLTFVDRSPGPILHGNILLGFLTRAEVNIALGANKARFVLDRVDP